MSYIAVCHKTAARNTAPTVAVIVALTLAVFEASWINTAFAESSSSATSPWSKEGGKELARYAETIEHFRKTAIGRHFFESAYAYAVFPTIAKVGFGVGGAHGKGVVYQGGEIVGKISVSQLSFGLQAGGKRIRRLCLCKISEPLKSSLRVILK